MRDIHDPLPDAQTRCVHSILYRPCNARTPHLEAGPLSSVEYLYLASSLRPKEQIDMNTAVGSVGCVTTWPGPELHAIFFAIWAGSSCEKNRRNLG